MSFLGVIILMGLAALILMEGWFDAFPIWKRFSGGVIALALFVSCVTTYGSFGLHLAQGKTSMLEPWNAFHYYLNAKYFPELGYTHLYECAYQADQAGNHFFDDPEGPARDLATYAEFPKQRLPACPTGSFTPERWKAFSADLSWLQLQPVTLPMSYGSDIKLYWNNMLFDKGYNLPPPFVFLSQKLTNLFPLQGGIWPFFVFWLDAIFTVCTLFVIGRWKGWRVAGLFALFLLFFFGSYKELFGLFLQNSWLCFLILSLFFWEKNKTAASGLMLAAAGVMRIFPFFLTFGPFLQLIGAVRQKDKVTRQRIVRWFVAIALSTGALLLLGCLTGRGWGVWGEYVHKMQVHTGFIQGEWFDIGWKNFLVTLGLANQFTISLAAYIISVIIGLTIFGYLAYCSTFIGAFLLGLLPIYLLIDLSPFYYFILGLPLLFVFEKQHHPPIRWMGTVIFVLLAIHQLLGWTGPEYMNDIYTSQPLAEGLLIMFYLFLIIGFFYSTWVFRKTSAQKKSSAPIHDVPNSELHM